MDILDEMIEERELRLRELRAAEVQLIQTPDTDIATRAVFFAAIHDYERRISTQRIELNALYVARDRLAARRSVALPVTALVG